MSKENAMSAFEGWEEGNESLYDSIDVTNEVINEVIEDNLEKDVEKTTEDVEKETLSEQEENEIFNFDEVIGNEDGNEDEDEDDIEVTKKNNTASPRTHLEFLKEKGFIDFTLEEGEELTDDLSEEILEDAWETSLENGVNDKIKDLPDTLKQMIKYQLSGGNFLDVLDNLSKAGIATINKDTDMEEESNQKLVIKQDLSEQGYDDEYIESHIQSLKDSGKLKSISSKLFDRKIDKQTQSASEQVEAKRIQKENAKEKQRLYKKDMSSHIAELENVKGIVINKDDKKNLPDYISNATVKLEDGRIITKMQQDLFAVFGNKDKTALLAKLLQSDFDFSSIERSKETEFSKKIKNNIQNTEKTKSKGSSQKTAKSLADALD